MNEKEEIIKQIQRLRLEMIKIQEGKLLIDPEVVAASQLLDVLLNKYEEILRNKKMTGDNRRFVTLFRTGPILQWAW